MLWVINHFVKPGSWKCLFNMCETFWCSRTSKFKEIENFSRGAGVTLDHNMVTSDWKLHLVIKHFCISPQTHLQHNCSVINTLATTYSVWRFVRFSARVDWNQPNVELRLGKIIIPSMSKQLIQQLQGGTKNKQTDQKATAGNLFLSIMVFQDVRNGTLKLSEENFFFFFAANSLPLYLAPRWRASFPTIWRISFPASCA